MDWIATVSFSYPEDLQVFWGATIKKLSIALMGHGPFMYIEPKKIRIHIEVQAETEKKALSEAWMLALGATKSCNLTFLSPLGVEVAARVADTGLAEEFATEANVLTIHSQAN